MLQTNSTAFFIKIDIVGKAEGIKDLDASIAHAYKAGESRTMYEYIKLYVANNRYLDKESEWKIIDNTVFKIGIMPQDANIFLQGAANIDNFATETTVERALDDIVAGLRSRSRRISPKQFDFLTDAALGLAQGEIDRDDARELAKAACERVQLRAAGSGLFRTRGWYRRIPLRTKA